MTISTIITGLAAAAVEQANRASFYGIHGNKPECSAAMRAITPHATDAVEAVCPDWNGYIIRKAHTIDTDGTKTPYMAEITIDID